MTERALVKDGIGGDRAVAGLRRMVLTGELAPGEQVRQEETAERLGVSRVLLREALRALSTQGLVEHRPHQGFFVMKRAPIEVAQIMLMLDLLEPQLMRTAQPASKATVAALKRLNKAMRSLVDEWDPSETLTLNHEFHFTLFDLSPYTLIRDEVDRLWALGEPFFSQKLSTPESRKAAVIEHDAIIAALQRDDLAAAAAAHDVHRRSGRRGVLPDLS